MKRQYGVRIWIIIIVMVFINMWTFKAFSQTGLTLEQALSTAESNSPTILKTRLNLTRSQENLNAQNAALKSKFALSVNPVTYSQDRAFNSSFSDFNTTKDLQSSGSLSVVQPFLPTDATITLSDNFSYNNNNNKAKLTTAGVAYNNNNMIQ